MWDKDLVPFQQKCADRMVREKRHGLIVPMGKGKTPTTTKAGYWAVYASNASTWLIVCPKNAIRVWEDHILEWFGGLDARFGRTTPVSIWRWRKRQQNTQERHNLWRQFTPYSVNVYITTYAAFVFDRAVHQERTYDLIILDEAKRIRSRKSKAFEALKPLCKACTYFWPMTGTPGRVPEHFWTMLHLMDPKFYGSYWRLVESFHHVITNEFGRKEVLGIRNESMWFWTLRTKFSLVSEDMIASEVTSGKVFRQRLFVELDDEQAKHYKELNDDMISEVPDGLILIPNTLVKTLRLRQLLVCPKILNQSLGYGAALNDLADTILDRDDPHVVIFTPFTDAFPYIAERLIQSGIPSPEIIHSHFTPDELVATIDRFRSRRSPIICSVLYAQAFSLEPADTAFFLGYEFNPEDNAQAERRLLRFTTKHDVTCYYYAYEQTYDDRLCEIVCIKQEQINKFLDAKRGGIKI